MKGKIVLRSGIIVELEDWQKMRGLPVGSAQISKYFSIGEKNKSGKTAIKEGFVINEFVLIVLDAYRERLGRPVCINSFDRTKEYQEKLRAQGYRAAKTSPHVVKMAVDIDTESEAETLEGVKILEAIARALDIEIRIGYKKYLADGNTFIHFDVCPNFFAPGRLLHKHPHPWQWERELKW